jgi:hypothetical protein
MKTDIDCLKNLHAAQLQQLRVFIEDLGYRKAAVRASEEFNQPIHKHALQRFMLRAAPAEFLDQDLDSEEASRQILKFAADGQPEFTATSVQILERLAFQLFQLSLTCNVMDEDMNALAKVSTMLCRFRNAAVRERMAAVQEGKLKLRQQQLEKSSTNDTDAQIEELNAKIAAAFESHPVLTAIRQAEEAAASHDSDADPLSPPSGQDSDADPLSPPRGEGQGEGCSSASASACVPPKNENPNRSSALCVPSVPSSVKSAKLAAPKRSDGGSAVNSSFPSLTSAQNRYENTTQT